MQVCRSSLDMDADLDGAHLTDQLQLDKVSHTCIVIDSLRISKVAFHLHVDYLLDCSLTVCRR